jgi:hypothetical protein
MNETTTLSTAILSGYSGTYGNVTHLDGRSGTFTYPNNLGLSTVTINQNNMVKQVKVAVFTVERSEDNKIISTTFVKELWVEVKNGTSLELTVAKQLNNDFDPSTTIIKEIYSVTF